MRISEMGLAILEHLVVVTVRTDEGLEGHGFAQKGRSPSSWPGRFSLCSSGSLGRVNCARG